MFGAYFSFRTSKKGVPISIIQTISYQAKSQYLSRDISELFCYMDLGSGSIILHPNLDQSHMELSCENKKK